MSSDSLRSITAAVRAGKLSLSERVAQKCKIIADKNPSLNALAYHDSQATLQKARELDVRFSVKPTLSRLCGTTFSTRLSIDVAGMPYSNGSTSATPTLSPESAYIVRLLERQGALCLGKGNIAERGKSFYTENPRYGRTNHFIDQALSPGGSGGGDAVAVATGMVDFAIGADAGGSLRVPAQFCGLFGLSTTPGSLSERAPTLPATGVLKLFKSLGILTRSLDDLEMVHSVIEGFDGLDPSSSETYRGPQTATNRFLIIDKLNSVGPAPEIVRSLKEAADRLEAAGFTRGSYDMEFLNGLIEPYVVLAAQAQLLLEDTLISRTGEAPPYAQEGMHIQALRARINAELPPLTAAELLYRWHQIDCARQRVAALFNEFDFILAPVCATLPVPHNTAQYPVNGNLLSTELVFQFATMTNALGLPAIAVPASPTPAGLPTGFQIIGPRFSERMLFSVLRQGLF